jgi:flagellar motor switch protein FliN/FliY
MSGSVAYEQFDESGGPATRSTQADGDLRRLSEVPVEASVEIGRIGMTVGETLELRVGSVIKLERLAGEPVDLLVNGTLIAQGEVVVADEQFGLRVTEIVEGDTNGTAASEDEIAAQPPASEGEPAAPAIEGTLQLQASEQPA